MQVLTCTRAPILPQKQIIRSSVPITLGYKSSSSIVPRDVVNAFSKQVSVQCLHAYCVAYYCHRMDSSQWIGARVFFWDATDTAIYGTVVDQTIPEAEDVRILFAPSINHR